jgi:WXG100 family type VII secretion target
MADRIAMTPQDMYAQAANFGVEATNITEIITKLDAQMSNLQSSWQGAASTEFNTRWVNDLKPALEQSGSLMLDIQQTLTDTARIVEQTDADLARQLQS